MKDFSKHLFHYIPLVMIFVGGVFAFAAFSYNKLSQIMVTVAVAVAYVIWGIIHHLIHKDLYLSTVIEYIVVASLGLVVVLSLILRA
jgi:c-di-AMP phosphodiesterase-like protein